MQMRHDSSKGNVIMKSLSRLSSRNGTLTRIADVQVTTEIRHQRGATESSYLYVYVHTCIFNARLKHKHSHVWRKVSVIFPCGCDCSTPRMEKQTLSIIDTLTGKS